MLPPDSYRRGVETCPECDGELATVEITGEKPVQGATRECIECETAVDVGITWFPGDLAYIVVGEMPTVETCTATDCDARTPVTVVSTMDPEPTPTCLEHLTAAERAAFTTN